MKRCLLYIFILAIPTVLSGQIDSTASARITRMYTLSADYAEVAPVDFDTLISGFQEYRQMDKLTPFYASLGNYGLPVLELDFFKRNSDPDQYLYGNLKPYMHHTGNKTFIETQVPFTELKFTFGGPRTVAEQYLGVRHSQNVNRFLNVGLDLDIVNSLGQYIYQSTDNRAFTLHSSYLGSRYRMFAAWSLNNMKHDENGGIVFEGSEITGVDDPSFMAGYDTRDIPVQLGRLNSATSEMLNRNILVVQRYKIGGGGVDNQNDTIDVKKSSGVEGTLSHIFSLDKTRRKYFDNLPFGGFYDTAYISNDTNNLLTRDSLFYRILKNTVRFDFATSESARFRLGIGVGIRNELSLYSQVEPTFDERFADTVRNRVSSNAIVGRVYNRIGEKFGWEAYGEFWISGYRAGDFDIHGSMNKVFGDSKGKTILEGRGSLVSSGPVWWQNRWGSNNFAWSNDFGKEVRAEAGGNLKIPGYGVNLSFDYALLTNYIYINRNAVPAQNEGSISLMTLRVEKNFSFWKFRFNNRLMLQKTSHPDIIPLPLLAAKSAFFFDHEFYFRATDGHLKMQLGVEGVYHTAYFAPSFMPATGSFYLQNRTEVGNYPFLNAFVSLKLKRTRLFVSFDHLNHGLMGYDYFTVPGYPMPVRTLKYGVAWTFYN